MDLLQHLVHVHRVALLVAALALLASFFWALVTAFLEPFLGAGADLAGSGMSIMTTPDNTDIKQVLMSSSLDVYFCFVIILITYLWELSGAKEIISLLIEGNISTNLCNTYIFIS